MAMSSDNGSFKIKVDFEATNNTSSVLDAVNGGLEELNNELAAVPAQAAGIEDSVTNGITNVSNGAKQSAEGIKRFYTPAMMTMQDLGRVISDLPYGFLGIANNIEPLSASFAQLRSQAGGTEPAIKAVLSSLAGPGGLAMVGIPIVTSLALAFGGPLVNSIMQGDDRVKELEKDLASLNQYKNFTISLEMVGMSGLQKAIRELQQLQEQWDVTKRIEKAKATPAWSGTDSRSYSLLPGMIGNPLGAGLVMHNVDSQIDKRMMLYKELGKTIVDAGKDYGDALNTEILTAIGYTEKQAKSLVYDNRLKFKINSGKETVDAESQKEIDEIRKKDEEARKKAAAAAKAQAKAYNEVKTRLDEEMVKITMSEEDYRSYVAIKKAHVSETSKQAQVIRAEVHALVELENQQKKVHQLSVVMLELDEQRRKMVMSPDDYKAYELIKKAGVDEFSPQAELIRADLKEMKDLSESLMMTMHDGVIRWVDSLSSSLNDLVWTANTSFGDILESFGRMVTEMYIKAQIINPLKSAIENAFYGSSASGAGYTAHETAISSMGAGASNTVIPKYGDGGIMTPYGDMPIQKYANGGIASATSGGQLANIAEAGMNEAIVPLPNGRSIPIDWRGGRPVSSGTQTIRVEIVNEGKDQLAVQSVEPSFDLEGQVVRIVMGSLNTNSGMRSAVKAAARS